MYSRKLAQTSYVGEIVIQHSSIAPPAIFQRNSPQGTFNLDRCMKTGRHLVFRRKRGEHSPNCDNMANQHVRIRQPAIYTQGQYSQFVFLKCDFCVTFILDLF